MTAAPIGATLTIPSGLPHQVDLWTEQTPDLRVAMVGPLGTGKSFGLAQKALLLALANPGFDGMLIVPTYSMAEMIHKAEWPGIWESLGITVRHVGGSQECWFWPAEMGGGRLWIRSAEKPERLVGPNLAYVLFDEPGQINEMAWKKGSLRARHPLAPLRQVACGGTPEGINWFADKFQIPSKGYRTVWAQGWHPDMHHYRDQLFDEFKHDPGLLDAYARGLFVPIRQGRAYLHFDRRVHCADLPIYDPDLPLVLACDFNVDTMRWIVMQFPPGAVNVLDEIALPHGGDTPSALARFIKEWDHHRGRVVVTGDASGHARSTRGASKTDYTIIREELSRSRFHSFRIRTPKSNPPVKDRIDFVNYHLAGRGHKIAISEKARNLVMDFERVVWRAGSTDLDKSDKSLTHASDAFGYGLLAMLPSAGSGSGGLRSGRVRGAQSVYVDS